MHVLPEYRSHNYVRWKCHVIKSFVQLILFSYHDVYVYKIHNRPAVTNCSKSETSSLCVRLFYSLAFNVSKGQVILLTNFIIAYFLTSHGTYLQIKKTKKTNILMIDLKQFQNSSVVKFHIIFWNRCIFDYLSIVNQ
jgi:hypothetical protein